MRALLDLGTTPILACIPHSTLHGRYALWLYDSHAQLEVKLGGSIAG